jgi:general secretion pathway protein A
MRAQCRALRQRITITYSIEPLTESETGEYIKHRLKIAGSENEIFNKKAIRKIYSFTRGFPRLINIICDQALLSGYVKDIQIITPAIIRECLKELSLPGEFNPGKTQQPESAMKRRGVRGAKTFRYASLFLLVVLFGYFLSTTHYHGYIKHLKKYTAILSESSAPPITEEQPRQSVKQDHNRIARSQISHQSEKTELSLEAPSASVSDDAHSVPTKPSGGLNAVETSFSPKDRNLIIPFNYKSNEMPENAYKSLDRFAEIMLRNSDVQISIKGYTDALGSHEYNKRLSSFRANIVKSYLVGKGISPTRIKSIGIGEKNPLKPNTSAEGRRANRRVEIELIADNSKD